MPLSKFPKETCVAWAESRAATGARIDPHAVGRARWLDGTEDDEVAKFVQGKAAPLAAAESPPPTARDPAAPLTLDEARQIVGAMKELGREPRDVIAEMPLADGDRAQLLRDFCPAPLAAGGG